MYVMVSDVVPLVNLSAVVLLEVLHVMLILYYTIYGLPIKPIQPSNFIGVGNATACVLHDSIYVTGGHYGYKGSCTYEKIQMYKAELNEWSIVTTCPHPGT